MNIFNLWLLWLIAGFFICLGSIIFVVFGLDQLWFNKKEEIDLRGEREVKDEKRKLPY